MARERRRRAVRGHAPRAKLRLQPVEIIGFKPAVGRQLSIPGLRGIRVGKPRRNLRGYMHDASAVRSRRHLHHALIKSPIVLIHAPVGIDEAVENRQVARRRCVQCLHRLLNVSGRLLECALNGRRLRRCESRE